MSKIRKVWHVLRSRIVMCVGNSEPKEEGDEAAQVGRGHLSGS